MSRAARFENKFVIVTGAAQGIGRGVALASPPKAAACWRWTGPTS